MDELTIVKIFTSGFKVYKVFLIAVIVLMLLVGFYMIYINTMVSVETKAALSEAKLSYDSGYYEPIVRRTSGHVITIRCFNLETGEEISEANNNMPDYGDIMRVDIDTVRKSFNIFNDQEIRTTESITVVNRGTFGEGYKYERR